MSKFIKFEIVTPERVVLKEEISQVSVPTKQGEITVLPGHIPLVAFLSPGVVEISNAKNEREIMSVSGGFIEVSQDKVVILADTAERAYEIDEERAAEAKKRAEKLMQERRTDQTQFTDVAARIAKELARTRAVNRWKKLKKGE